MTNKERGRQNRPIRNLNLNQNSKKKIPKDDRKSVIKHNYNSFIGEDYIMPKNCRIDMWSKNKDIWSVFYNIFLMI